MKTKNETYTPGPLEVTVECENETWGVCLPDGGDVLAQLIEKREDAVLYSAAPDLLEAAKEAVRRLEGAAGYDYYTGALIAAIAKAERR